MSKSKTTDTIARIHMRLNEMLGLVPPQWQWTCQTCKRPSSAPATDYKKSDKGTRASVSLEALNIIDDPRCYRCKSLGITIAAPGQGTLLAGTRHG